MRDRRLATRWLFAALAVITSAGLFTAAALASAPPVVLPLLVAVCIGLPMIAAWELRSQVGSSRRARGSLDRTALAQLRRHLDELPETQHPLGL